MFLYLIHVFLIPSLEWVTSDGQVCHEPLQLQPESLQEDYESPFPDPLSPPSASPSTPVKKARTPQPKFNINRKRIVRSPPKTSEEAVQRQRNFGRISDVPTNTYAIKTLAKNSTLNTFPGKVNKYGVSVKQYDISSGAVNNNCSCSDLTFTQPQPSPQMTLPIG